MNGSDQNLITEAELENLGPSLDALIETVNAHSGLPYQQVHQQWVQTGQSTYDNATTPATQAPHKTGRSAIRVKVGAVFYLLPADANQTGPPQFARVTVQPTTQTSNGPAGQPQQAVTYTVTCVGTPPFTFTWQLWDTSVNQFVDGPVGGDYMPGFSGTRWKVNQVVSNSSGTSQLVLDSASPASGDYIPATYVRVKIENEAGITYSNQVSLNIHDDTDCI
jgi:hypothetical protein